MKQEKVLIVGGGLAGTILGLTFFRKEIPFTLIDNNLKDSASTVAAGIFNPLVFKRYTLSWRAKEHIESLYEFCNYFEAKFQTHFHPLDFLKAIEHKDELDLFYKKKSKDEFQSFLGEEKNMDSNAAINKCLSHISIKSGGWLDIIPFLNNAHDFLKENDSFLNKEFSYSDLQQTEAGVSYQNTEYSKVIFAEGFHVKNNPWFGNIPLKPVKGEVLTIECKDLKLEHSYNKNIFILPLGENKFRVGATYNWDDLTNQTTEQGKQELIEKLNKAINREYKIINHKAGVRPASIDRRPIIGIHPKHKNLYVFNGFGTKGVMLIPLWAKHLVEHFIFGKEISNEVNLLRFNL